jgi:protein disulfide-isomerase A1
MNDTIYFIFQISLLIEYSEAALVLQKNDPPLSLAKVDATEQKKLAERFGIQGFPTLVWFK